MSRDLKERHPGVDWAALAGVRNALAHEYFRAEPEDVWKTATEDISRLKRRIEDILAELETSR